MSRAFKTIREWVSFAWPIALVLGFAIWTRHWWDFLYLVLWWGLMLLFIGLPSLRDDEFGNQGLVVASGGVALVAAAALIAVYVVEDLLLFALMGAVLVVTLGVGMVWERLTGGNGDEKSTANPPDDIEDWQRRRDAEIKKLYPHV